MAIPGRRRGLPAVGARSPTRTFESALRYLGGKVGAKVNAHMFGHSLAQALVETCGLKVAQEVLGHRHLTTTADTYARVDQAALVRALEAANAALDRAGPETPAQAGDDPSYAFPYDATTLAELERLAGDHGELR